MGKVRFRKTSNLGGGAKITVSPKGVGGSIGLKGARIGRGTDGKTRVSASIPGSGLSYQHTVGSGKNRSAAPQQQAVPTPMPPAPRRRGLPWWGWVLIVLLVLGLLSNLFGGGGATP